MSTSNTAGNNYTAAITPPLMANLIDSALWNGKVRSQMDVGVVTNGTSDVNSTIKVGKLKPGDVPLAFFINASAMSAAITATIGDGNNASLYGAITTMASASKQLIPSGNIAPVGNTYTDIVLTLGGANANTNGTIQVTTLFVRKE